MIINKTKNGVEIVHPTGVKQVLTKTDLQRIADIMQDEIDQRQSYKLQLQSDIDEISNLEMKSL